jgi:hypothetical protein
MDFDYTFIYKILYAKLKKVEKAMETNVVSKHAGWEREHKQIKTCRILTERLYKEEYGKMENFKKFKTARGFFAHTDNVKNQDKEMLFKMLSKYISHWWF